LGDKRQIAVQVLRKILYAVLACFWLVSAVRPVCARQEEIPVEFTAAEQQWLADHPVLKVGVGVAFPPFMWVEETDNRFVFKGIVSDYLNLISNHLGIDMQIEYGISFGEALTRAKNGTIDYFPCLSKTVERSEYLIFTDPYLSYPMVIITREDAPIIGGLNDLSGKKIAVVAHLVVYSTLRNAHSSLGLTYTFTKTVDENLEAVSIGQADACIINLAAASYYIQKKGLTNLKVSAPVNFQVAQYAMGVRKDLAPLKGILTKVLASISQAKKDQISQRWIRVEYPLGVNLKKVWHWALAIGVFFFFILFVFYRWNRRLRKEIKERISTQAALKKSEQQMSALMANLPGLAYRCLNDSDWTMLFLSQGCKTLTGYQPSDLLFNEQMSYNDLIHPNDRDTVRKAIEQAIEKQSPFTIEYRIITRDKQTKWVWAKGVYLERNEQEDGVLDGFILDISDRKKARRDQEKLLDLLTRAERIGKSGSFSLDLEAQTAYFSKGGYDIRGISDQLPPSIELHLQCIHEDDLESHRAEFKNNLASKETHFIQSFRIVRPDGKKRHIQAEYQVERDHKGRALKVSGTNKDITEKIEMETRSQQAQKMESIGNLAGGIAHEFNNVLSIIIGNNELLMQELPPDSIARKNAEEIRVAGMRARDVVKQLLTFSRKDDAAMTPIDVQSVVQQSLKLIRSSIPANIEIKYNQAPVDYHILGNETQINQLLINLCSNAVHAISGENGWIKVSLSNERVQEVRHLRQMQLKPGRYVKMTVIDNGQGMDQLTMEKIFEPYFTTKEVGKGSGIGLAIVHGIVQRHHGAIDVSSRQQAGTRFTIWLPIHKGDAAVQIQEHQVLPTGDETILFVEDEPALAKLGQAFLENHGYRVETFIDPVSALEQFSKNPDQFDLVITDMAMPKMTGDQLVRKMMDIRKGMPSIICTGYSETFSKTDAQQLGVRAFLIKPVDKAMLITTVRSVLDEDD
jgi:PAS domain S-box-containing protein